MNYCFESLIVRCHLGLFCVIQRLVLYANELVLFRIICFIWETHCSFDIKLSHFAKLFYFEINCSVTHYELFCVIFAYFM